MDRAELQAVQLALAFGLGLGLGFFYDLYRVWFRRMRGRLWAALGDIIWWLAALAYVFAGLYHINGGQLRLPVLALAAAGVCLYMGFFSPVLFPGLSGLLAGLARLAGWLWGCFGGAVALLLTPLVWLVELVFGLLGLLGRILGWLGGVFLWALTPCRQMAVKLRRRLKKRIKKVDFEAENDI